MKHSEIFNSFVKIAEEKGLISNDSSEAKKQLEKTHRADSMDITAIEALYGVKPDAPKGMDYKLNIMEVAHPNSVVVSPSYDRLNGLVENNNERQNIILNIVNKQVNGYQTQHKYAEKELILSLVRIGNDLDNNGKAELAALADYCLTEVTDSVIMKKTAQDPITLTIAGIAATLGGIWLKNHMRFISDGLDKDHTKLINEIDDILTSNKDWGVGTQYKQNFTSMMIDFKNKIESFYNLFKKIEPIIDQVEKPRDAKELEEVAKQDNGQVQKALTAFQAAVDYIYPQIDTMIKNFGNEQYKQRQTEDKGWMTSLVDATQILHGGKGLVADDLDDVQHALQTYKLDIENIKKLLADTGSLKDKVTRDLQASIAANPPVTPKSENITSDKKEESIADIDNYASQLSKTFL